MLKYSLPWLLSLRTLLALSGGVRAGEPSSASHQLDEIRAVIHQPYVVARRFIPSEQRKEGELRLLADGDERRLQILLYTSSLGRALREMRKSEEANWPVEKLWHPSSKVFLEKLDLFRAHLRTKEPEDPETPYTFNVLVELRSGVYPASVRFAEVSYTGSPDALTIAEETEFTSAEFPAAYVSSNQFFMVREGFDLSAEETTIMLKGTDAVSD